MTQQKKKISATIVADSVNPLGDRVTTMLLTFPRFILPELNTHRVFSKNSASSRAIPFEKMVKMVKEDPFIPIAWMKDHKGMQGTEYIKDQEAIKDLEFSWNAAKIDAISWATHFTDLGLTKQICNRLLEPFMWHTVLLTATEFSNFFELRCPCYVFNFYPENRPEALEPSSASFKSRKDLIKFADDNGYYLGSVQELNSEEFWLEMNCSEAEIHMQALAEAMWDAMRESVPKQLESGAWHIPFGDKISEDAILPILYTTKAEPDLLVNYRVKVATARCARLSYNTFDGEVDYKKDLELYNKLLRSDHFSPFEHCCVAMSEEDYDNFIKLHNGKADPGWCNNFKGFIQYRYILENA